MVIGPVGEVAECRAKARSWSTYYYYYYYYYFASTAVVVSSSALWSIFSPPSNFVNGHVSTMWFMVCRRQQSQEGDWARPYLCKLARHGKRFIRDHVWRGWSKPGCQIVGSVTIEWLTTAADDQSSLYCVTVSNCVDRCYVWPYWASRCKQSRWMLKDISIHRPISMGFSDLKHTVMQLLLYDDLHLEDPTQTNS